MFAIALLYAKMLAVVLMAETQVWVANRFNEMVQLALPLMVLPAEEARRRLRGLRPHDA